MRAVHITLMAMAASGPCACSEVIIEPSEVGGAGGQGTSVTASGNASATASVASTSSSGAGGAPPDPINVELVLQAESGLDPAAVTVVLNDASGALKATFSGAQLPLEIQAVDGDLVSFRWDALGLQFLDSYRVTPDVFRIVEVAQGGLSVTCALPPMEVTVTLPPISGADEFVITTDRGNDLTRSAPGEYTFDVSSCEASFDLFAYATDQDGVVIAYQLVEALPFTQGGAMAVPLELASTEMHLMSVEVAPLDSAEHFSAFANWQGAGAFVSADDNFVSMMRPPSSVAYSPQFVSPRNGYGRTTAQLNVSYPVDPDGLCPSAILARLGEAEGPLTFNPERLARPRGMLDGSWQYVEAGEDGDAVRITRLDDAAFGWTLFEDPGRPPVVTASIELPAELPPIPALTYVAAASLDVVERDGYAAFLSAASDGPGTTREQRSTKFCP